MSKDCFICGEHTFECDYEGEDPSEVETPNCVEIRIDGISRLICVECLKKIQRELHDKYKGCEKCGCVFSSENFDTHFETCEYQHPSEFDNYKGFRYGEGLLLEISPVESWRYNMVKDKNLFYHLTVDNTDANLLNEKELTLVGQLLTHAFNNENSPFYTRKMKNEDNYLDEFILMDAIAKALIQSREQHKNKSKSCGFLKNSN